MGVLVPLSGLSSYYSAAAETAVALSAAAAAAAVETATADVSG